jgi:hypothetical protein
MHASDILNLSQANPNEALKKAVNKLFTNRCPELALKNYIIPPRHFDQSYKSSAVLLQMLYDINTDSHLNDIYKEGSYIKATAVNLDLLLKNKIDEKDASKITSPDTVIALLEESYRLGIKLTVATHEFNKHVNSHGSTVFEKDHILLCHSTVAGTNNNGEIEKSKPQFLEQKLLAYCYVKGIIDDKDVRKYGLDLGIHARPMEHFIKEYQKEGIKPFDFIKQKATQIEIY